jgi:hypothetical protein
MDKALPEYASDLAAPNDEIQRDVVAKRLAVTWLRANPDKWFYLVQGKFRRLWTPFYLGERRQTAGNVNSLYFGGILILFLLGLLPVTAKLVQDRHPALVMHALILATVMMALVFHGQHRYRFPIDGFCVSIAAVTLTRTFFQRERFRLKDLWKGLLGGIWRHRNWLGPIGAAGVVLGVWWWVDQRHMESYRRETCRRKLAVLADAIGQYKSRHDRLPDQLPDLMPEFIPNLDGLHCPSHSIGWHEYQLLNSDDVRGKEFVVSYDLRARGFRGPVLVTELRSLHDGGANSIEINQE